MPPPLKKILVVCGQTASGKSDLAVRLAKELDGEIVNADSMQLFKGMNIGTAKPSADQCAGVRHHLIDVVEPDHPFSAADFVSAADAAIGDIDSRGKRPIVAGGTGLYIRALLKGLVDSPSGAGEVRAALSEEAKRVGNSEMLERLRVVDPALASTIHPNNLVRIIRALEVHRLTGVPLSSHQRDHAFATRRYESMQIAISTDRSELYRRIEDRVDKMISDGLLDEVRGLLTAGLDRGLKSMRSIGYKEAASFLAGEISLDESIRLIKRDTRRYAKRQETWFKADPDILWFEYPENFGTLLRNAIDFFERREA